MPVPLPVAPGAGSLIYVWFEQSVPPLVVLHRMAAGVDSLSLLAIFFFIMSGSLMNSAGITQRIYSFATAVANAGGLGTIEIKAIRDHGYPVPFAVGLTAASSTIGPIITPSLPMMIHGVMANTSVG